ncbi:MULTISPECIES: hypothetical protein [unclassified Solwaraspora]|uniref:hypothetical protein n=1 Tax=unclassified Solwaraspora TaxID=2627926 RepID=UPI00259B08E7|nr:hypothetical protein [Solwaraspora sp. WMMA2056]WJK38186.1 hypothetical protein O7608_16850 [Solwaraspora sp. WMMA2056]
MEHLPTILAVVVGGVLTYVGTGLTERSRWQREQAVRWDERRLAGYVEFAATAKRIALLSSRVLASRGVVTAISPIGRDEGLALLGQAESDRSVQFESVLLLADEPTITAAQTLTETLWRLEAFATGDEPVDEQAWREGFADYRQARAEFYRWARRDMGVRPARIPTSAIASRDVRPPGSLAATGTD